MWAGAILHHLAPGHKPVRKPNSHQPIWLKLGEYDLEKTVGGRPCVCGRGGVYGKPLYLSLNFAVNLKLL